MDNDQTPTTGRDFASNPYSPDERRVADWLIKRTQGLVGTGDDPIGFVLASYELTHNQKTLAVSALRKITTEPSPLMEVIMEANGCADTAKCTVDTCICAEDFAEFGFRKLATTT